MSTLVIVGAGPRATGLLERIAANADGLLPPDHPLDIHLVDPHPAGPGRIWRDAQSSLLRMNSMAEDVTLFTDERSVIDGPVRPGPSLAEWAPRQEGFAPYRPVASAAVEAELRTLAPTDFPTRRAQSAYLDWALRRALAELPPQVTVTTHRDTVLSVTGPADGPQLVELSDRVLTADQVVLALGHLAAEPDPRHDRSAAFAERHGLFHLPPAFTADTDLSGLAPGEHTLVRGFGLAFVDLLVLLTEGRGGRYEERPDGRLRYLPSGAEPVLHVGSRRGVPYHSKTGYRLQGPPAPLPRYFDQAAVDGVLSLPGELELRRDVWPLMAKEIGLGHYHELFHAHPSRVTLGWPEFLAEYDRLGWYDAELAELVAKAVPDPADRLDFERLDRPLAGREFTPEGFQAHLVAYVEADADRRADPAHSADLGAFLALLSLFGQLPRLVASGRLTDRSTAEELEGWWFGFFSFLASGPPGFRLRELVALAEAGVVRFLGGDLTIGTDERSGTFTATSPTVPGHVVHGTALIECYLPEHTLERSTDPVLRGLLSTGAAAAQPATGLLLVDPADARVLSPDGTPHPRRTALGPYTTARTHTAFARPRTNAPGFRQNDAVARRLLVALREGSDPTTRRPVAAT